MNPWIHRALLALALLQVVARLVPNGAARARARCNPWRKRCSPVRSKADAPR